jgi:hypothetical protein
MSIKIKVKTPLRQYREVPLSVVTDTYDNKKSLSNTMTILRPLLTYLGLPPDVIKYDEMNRQASDIIKFIRERYPDSNGQRVYLKYICSVLTRTGFGQDHRLNKLVDKEYQRDIQQGAVNVPSWTDTILPILDDVANDLDMSPIVRIIAYLYSFGYVFRPTQIFTTKVVKSPDNNYLDLDTGRYEIKNQKNGKKISFMLPKKLVDLIRPLSGSTYLLEQRHVRGTGYVSSRTHAFKYHGWDIDYSVHDFRHSYDTWLHKESNLSTEEIKERDRILGHTVASAKSYYVEAE